MASVEMLCLKLYYLVTFLCDIFSFCTFYHRDKEQQQKRVEEKDMVSADKLKAR